MAEARPSASVILVRDSAQGLETFMVRRHVRSAVAPNAYVFPGGTLRADDLEFDPAPDAVALARANTPRCAAGPRLVHEYLLDWP